MGAGAAVWQPDARSAKRSGRHAEGFRHRRRVAADDQQVGARRGVEVLAARSQSLSVPGGMRNRAANSSCDSFNARRITRTRGVRFMRFMSSGVSGRASGSLEAAAWRSAAVMSSKRLQSCWGTSDAVFMVLSSFMRFGSSGRNDSCALAPHREGDIEQAALRHADDRIAVFAMVLSLARRVGQAVSYTHLTLPTIYSV